MLTPAYARTMARYNTWQNASLFREASRLDDAARKLNRGAFFGSIHGTLAHLVFGDMGWLYRFTKDEAFRPLATSIAESATVIPDWEDLWRRRGQLDRQIEAWAETLTVDGLAGDLTYHSMAFGRSFTKPMGLLVAHMFNHQTHHRGQVHCLLTQAGLAPDDTDLPLLPERL